MKKSIWTLILIAVASLLVYLIYTNQPTIVFNEKTPVPQPPKILDLPVAEKVGQLFMVGHWADTPIASTTELIKAVQAGGVIIMSAPADAQEIKTWVKTWNKASKTPLLVAIDQEGGSVNRLQTSSFLQTKQRNIDSEKKAYEVGLQRGQELAALGINMNFAPVLDSAHKPGSFMYDRSFPDRDTSASFASSMIKGFKENGVIGSAKHFPGHADTQEDSHHTLPTVDIPRSELDEFTKPFRELIDSKPPALMTAHVSFPKIDSRPATLSHFFLTDYLRDELGFTGVIVTDDMSMDAIDKNWTTSEAALLSIQAGADMVLFAAEPQKVIPAHAEVINAVANGKLQESEIDQHYRRIVDLK